METDAFGLQWQTPGQRSRFNWKGGWGYYDEDGGAYLVGHRWYDADAGRFVTKDLEKSGRNWWLYCDNNPANGIDPERLQSTSTPPGRIALTEILIEMAKEEGGRHIGRLIMLQKGNLVRHHLLPKAFADRFRSAGIDIEKVTMKIPEWFHKYLHRGQKFDLWEWLSMAPSRGGWWNNKWAEFFKRNPKATKNKLRNI